jgi:hypothetical protein
MNKDSFKKELAALNKLKKQVQKANKKALKAENKKNGYKPASAAAKFQIFKKFIN